MSPFFNVVGVVAVPLIMSVYLGVAEAAPDLALRKVAKKRNDPEVWYLVGEMENALATAQMAVREAIDICADYTFAPDETTFNAVVTRKTIAAQAMMAVVEKALETVGGGGIVPWHGSGTPGARYARGAVPPYAKQATASLHRTRGSRPGSGGLNAGQGVSPWRSNKEPQARSHLRIKR